MVRSSESPPRSEGDRGLPTPVKVEQGIAQVNQQPLSHMAAHHQTSPSLDPAQSSSYANMEYSVESELGSMSSSNKRSYDSMVYEDDEGKKRYDPSNEPLPRTPLHHPSFFLAESIASHIPAEILDIVEESGCNGEIVQYIRDHAKLAKTMGSPDDVLVGLTGDSGTGKSSLINSLLGIDDEIAPCGSDGACTAVVQEFRKPHQSQEAPYESEILFNNLPTRNKALRKWVTDFWDCEEANADLSDDRFVNDTDGASTAATALFSLFCDHPECEDVEKTREFLLTAKVRGDPAIVVRLQAWMESLLSKHHVKDNKITVRSHTPDGLQYKVSIYMQHVMRNGKLTPSPWPLVRIVRTFLHAPLLAQGIVLADLPGISDVNQTRVRAAKRYSRRLEYTIVVSNITRARTDKATQRHLIDAFRHRRGPSVCMVATHSDLILTSRDYFKDCYNRASQGYQESLSMLDDQLKNTNSRLNDIKRKKNEARKRRDTDSENRLREEMDKLKLEHVTQQIKRSETCVESRNSNLAAEFSKKYSQHMRGTDLLPVVCVSNSVYMDYVRGYDPAEPPRIGVHATGIPKLKEILICLPAHRKFESFKHHREIKIPSLLNSINIAFNDGWLKEKEDLQKIILVSQDSIPNEIGSVFNRLLEDDLLVVIGEIETNKSNYVEPALSRLTHWSTKWHPGTYKAFSNNSGNYQTKKKGPKDWNCEMLETLVKSIEKNTHHWENLSIQLTEDLSRCAEGIVNALVTKLEVEAASRRVALQPFFEELHLQRDHLKARCEAVAEEFEQDLIFLRDCILTTEHIHESYFVLAMQEAYDECARTNGKGSHKRRCEILRAHVSDIAQGPFQKMHDKAEVAARELIKKHSKKLTDEFSRTIQNFHRTFMIGFKTEEYDPPDLRTLRAKLQSKVPVLKAKLYEIDRHLADCKEFESE